VHGGGGSALLWEDALPPLARHVARTSRWCRAAARATIYGILPRPMAKRTVRKQRREGVAAPAPAPAPAAAPAWRSRTVWLGGLVVGAVVAALVAGGFLLLGGDDASSVAPPAADDGVPTAAEIQSEFDERDKQQIEELTNAAREVARSLSPAMGGLAEAMPYEGGEGEPAAAADVQDWLDSARDAAAPYQESISGSTGHNVARNTVRSALDGLVAAIGTYRLSLAASGADAEPLRALAAEQRDNAVRTWSAAGVQLDAINVDAGFGHQHVAQLAGPESGAQPPDSLPEGTDAHPE
jgi:hypothetical protein